VFPLWHGTMPALLKAFLEHVMRPGVALQYCQHGFPKGLLTGCSGRLVVLGMVDAASAAKRQSWLDRMRGLRQAPYLSPAMGISGRSASRWPTAAARKWQKQIASHLVGGSWLKIMSVAERGRGDGSSEQQGAAD
jgi:Flavodoxin-like fold